MAFWLSTYCRRLRSISFARALSESPPDDRAEGFVLFVGEDDPPKRPLFEDPLYLLLLLDPELADGLLLDPPLYFEELEPPKRPPPLGLLLDPPLYFEELEPPLGLLLDPLLYFEELELPEPKLDRLPLLDPPLYRELDPKLEREPDEDRLPPLLCASTTLAAANSKHTAKTIDFRVMPNSFREWLESM